MKGIGAYNNSIIIFTSDHGEEFLDHEGWDHGHTLYEELLRVPLLIKLPHAHKKIIDKRLVSLIDIYPTILKILRLDIPPTLQGLPLISENGKPFNTIPYIFSERLPAGKGEQSIRDLSWKFIFSHVSVNKPLEPPLTKLYDLKNDPGENNDLSEEHPMVVKFFQKKLFEFTMYATNNSIKTKTKSISSETIEKLKTLGYVQ